MNFSAALTTDTHERLARHLIRPDEQEDLCFGIWRPSQGRRRLTAIVAELVMPQPGERKVHGNASFSDEYFLRAAFAAADGDGGLVLLHSHPGGSGWQRMSRDDIAAESGHAAQALAITGLPLVGMTLAGVDLAWSARFWNKRPGAAPERDDAETVRVVGDRLQITFNERLRPAPVVGEELERTVSSWGSEVQATLARIRVGVVGAGSVGSLVSEAVARTGIADIAPIDFDAIERRNLDRVLHARRRDAEAGRAKVDRLAEALRESTTAADPQITPLELSIVEPEGFAEALDRDVLFSCVDRPWPRQALNYIAYTHLIPVVDGGIRVRTRNGERLLAADWKAHIAAPGRPCLECLGQYDPGLVAAEREGLLDDPRYIEGLPPDHPARAGENVFAFGMAAASLEVLQLLSMVTAPSGIADTGSQNYHFVTGELDIDSRACAPDCPYSHELQATGDRAPFPPPTAHHPAAERARAARAPREKRELTDVQDPAEPKEQ